MSVTTSSGASSLGLVETRTVTLFDERDPLVLASGATLAPVEVAYETYGTLNAARTNAVYVCHALTGDAHAAGHHGNSSRPGWWDTMIGPGKPIDTDRLFVISSNLLGGCNGTTGPSSIDPRTGAPYGLRFPAITMQDLVTVHRALCRHLGVERLRCVIGGSLGGMQALQWVLDAPDELDSAVLACSTSRLSAQNIAFSEVARQSILRDPDFHGGDYYDGRAAAEERPRDRAHGRAHHLPLRGADGGALRPAPAARRTRSRTAASTSTSRSRAISTTRATASPSASTPTPTSTTRACSTCSTRFPMSTRRYRRSRGRTRASWSSASRRTGASAPPTPQRITRVLERNGVPVSSHEVRSPFGHDSFLLDVPEYLQRVQEFVRDVEVRA